MDSFSNIIYDWIQGIVSFFDYLFSCILYFIIKLFGTNNYIPNMDRLKTHILNETIYNNLIEYMKYVGTVAAIALFAINFFLLWQAGLKEAKDSVITAIERVFIAVIMIAISTQLLGVFHGRVLAIHNKYLEITTGNYTNSDGTSFYDWEDQTSILESLIDKLGNEETEQKTYDTNNKEEASKEVRNDILAAVGDVGTEVAVVTLAAPVIAVVGVLITIIHLIMMFLLVYYFIKLVIELIKRYLSFCLLNITFPAACGSLACGYTSNIFWMFVKSYVSEALCLTLTKIFIDIGVEMVGHLGFGIDRIFIICSWIQIGLNLEQWFKDHGFCISAAGGNVVDGMVTSAARMSMAAHGARNTAGSIATNAATAMGHNVPLAMVGEALKGNGFSEEAAIRGMQNSAVGGIEKLVSSVGGGKGQASLGKSEQESMLSLFRDGSRGAREAFGSRLNSLNASDREELFKGIQGSLLNGNDGKLNMADSGFAKTFGEKAAKNLSLTGVDSKGNLTGTIQGALGNQNVTIGTNAINSSSQKFQAADGNDMYMTYGDVTKPTIDNGLAFENFTDSMETEALSNSEFDNMSDLDADDLTAFRGLVNDLNQEEVLSNSPNGWSFVRDEQGNEAAVCKKDGHIYAYAKSKNGETAFYDEYESGDEMKGNSGKTLAEYEKSFREKNAEK